MKKIIFIILLLPVVVFAEASDECTYSDQVTLQSLAVHVNYAYEFNEDNETFSLIFNNVVDDIIIVYSNIDISTNDNNQVIIKNIKPGTSFTASIKGSYTNACTNVSLRTIRINVPYVNPYYNTNACIGYEEVSVCKSKFFDYEITASIFKNTIETYLKGLEEKNEQPADETIIDNVTNFFKNYGIQIALVLVSVIPTIIIGNIMLRKAKHGF